MLPDHLCRRDVPGLGEAVLARDYAVLEGLDEDEVLASIRGRRVLGTLYRGEWYVEAPAFCEERLELLRQQECRSTSHPQPLRRTSTASITEEELSHARVLGLRSKVTLDDIKRCYRERMQEYHPDKVSSLGQKLRELADAEAKKINLAYEFFNVKRATAFQRCEPLGMSPL